MKTPRTLQALSALTLVLLTTSAFAQSKTKVTIMTWEGNSTNQSIMNALSDFEKQNPDIDVELVNVPAGGYDQARNGLIQAKKLPDLFWVGNDQVLDYARQGILFDWSKYAAKEKALMARFAPGSIDNYKLDGKLYGLPSLMNTYGYFYNADLFKQAGVPLPKANWTYREFFDAARKLTVKDGNRTVRYGVYGPLNGIETLSQYSLSAGGVALADRILNTSKVTITPQMVEGAKMWSAAIKDGIVTPRTYPSDGMTEVFLSGKIPMLGAGQWLASGFLDSKPNFKWGFAPMPIVKNKVHILDAVGIASPSYIKNPDAVWKVLKYLDTKAWEKVLVDAPVAPAAYVPASKPYYDKLKAAGVSSLASSVDAMVRAQSKVGVRFLAPAWSGKANDVIGAVYNDIISGNVDIQNGLDKMAADINTLIQKSH
ncbi:ABC transporter substrate-binding protein [Deinococcus roseus]|uniref:ABC transporter substrate-binding protein n=1 Tax=Deinococcus roseus TaxID=392414 RepID=A0ABQ2D2I9_9DEIO|nr:sugar ABC transporter substrate-binding protein [Deinococcus roseus]GGJ43295.1 ABC transporter substrate-binding protein [Deinococcus roseus]